MAYSGGRALGLRHRVGIHAQDVWGDQEQPWRRGLGGGRWALLAAAASRKREGRRGGGQRRSGGGSNTREEV
jgi:hypothetical protein